MNFAKRILEVSPSETLEITSIAKKMKQEGHDVVSMASGEPDFDTPDFIKKEAIKAIEGGFTKYTPAQGILELRELICQKLKKDNNLEYLPEQIVVSNGAKHSIYNIIQVLVDQGDEVLIISPYWLSYPEMVKLAQAKPIIIKTVKENNYRLTPALLEQHITKRTKLLILNSPSNPTGQVYSKEEIKQFADVCVKHNILVISDEIYEKIIFDNKPHISIASLGSQINDLTITVNGMSKSYSMTGWRIGYACGPKAVMKAVANLQSHATSNPCSISQKAAFCALKNSEITKEFCRIFEKRRNLIVELMRNVSEIEYINPEGAFYLFCNISKFGLPSAEFAKKFLIEEKVAVIPGAPFGFDEFIRLSFAASESEIEKGITRLKKFICQKQ
ncbi:MAG: pyridoxal phosphate-dependent aminotransferase [Candidatus Omnitrophota bacterium]